MTRGWNTEKEKVYCINIFSDTEKPIVVPGHFMSHWKAKKAAKEFLIATGYHHAEILRVMGIIK